MKKIIFSCFAIWIGIGIGFNGVSDVNALSYDEAPSAISLKDIDNRTECTGSESFHYYLEDGSKTAVDHMKTSYRENDNCDGGLANLCCPIWNVEYSVSFGFFVSVTCTTGGSFQCENSCPDDEPDQA